MISEHRVLARPAWLWIVVMAGVAGWVPGGHELMADEVDPPPTALTGVWAPRREFEAAGVAPFAVLTVEGWGNVDGGLGRGGWLQQRAAGTSGDGAGSAGRDRILA